MTTVADDEAGYAMTLAPLVVKDKVIVGIAGGEFGIRGFIAAFDAKTGKEVVAVLHRFPVPASPATRPGADDAWKTRRRLGLDHRLLRSRAEPDLLGHRQSRARLESAQRPGDNLYTDSVVALDADTGKLKWHFQFTPHDECDWDAVQIPVLVDVNWNGTPRKLMCGPTATASSTCSIARPASSCSGKPFVKQNWASGFDAKGRPIRPPQLARRAPTLSGHAGRHELVLAVVQSAHADSSTSPPGRTIATVFTPQADELRRRASGSPAARRPTPARRRHPPRSNQHLDRRGRPRRHPRDRSADRREEVGVQDARRHRRRHPDHRLGSAVQRRPRRLLLRARRAHRRAAVEGAASAARSAPARSPIRWTGSSTSPSPPATSLFAVRAARLVASTACAFDFTPQADSTYNAGSSMTRPAFTIVAQYEIALSGGLCMGVVV